MDSVFVKTASRFVVVGGISTLFNYLIFYFLAKYTTTNYVMASVIGYGSGLVLGFFLNNSWTFGHQRYQLKQALGYGMVYLISGCISAFVLYVTVNKLHGNKYLMNIIVICISTLLNFFGLNTFIYKKK